MMTMTGAQRQALRKARKDASIKIISHIEVTADHRERLVDIGLLDFQASEDKNYIKEAIERLLDELETHT